MYDMYDFRQPPEEIAWQTLRKKAWGETDKEILEQLSNHPNPIIRQCVAMNENCPDSISLKLCEDKVWWVRQGISWRKNCPSWLLEKLSGLEQESGIRASVALHKNCPLYIRERLKYDWDEIVRKAAYHNIL